MIWDVPEIHDVANSIIFGYLLSYLKFQLSLWPESQLVLLKSCNNYSFFVKIFELDFTSFVGESWFNRKSKNTATEQCCLPQILLIEFPGFPHASNQTLPRGLRYEEPFICWMKLYFQSLIDFAHFVIRRFIHRLLLSFLMKKNVQIPSAICFSPVDGENACSGETFQECLDILNKSDKVSIVGINCSSPQCIGNLILKFREVSVFCK